ncbi:MAG: iron chelate uptake ABC transporter family permease subunit [Bifidobacteriaceae bacterium]|jgi:iron complex transport system permease protein|nr:iron chelate uptake ABC transporter family permease subunit [Bifidobacteriaceae bacterium]
MAFAVDQATHDGLARARAGQRAIDRRAWLVTAVAGAVALAFAAAILLYDNPAAPGSAAQATVTKLRATTLAAIALVAAAQGVATAVFHTVCGNRVITPSIMGFDALHSLVQTATVFFFGAAALGAGGVWRSVGQCAGMALFAVALYGWLLGRPGLTVRVALLVGLVLGLAFRAAATLMQRLLNPSDFDLVTARLFGNMSNADTRFLPLGAALAAGALALVWSRRRHLDLAALGSATARGLGLNHRREVMLALLAVSGLIAVATTLVGPMTFFGFLAASLTYRLAPGARHARLLPAIAAVAAAVLLAAYFTLRHVFYAGGLISVVIEFVGGLFFLAHLLKGPTRGNTRLIRQSRGQPAIRREQAGD